MAKSKYICPDCAAIMLSSVHVCSANLQSRWDNDMLSLKTKLIEKESTMSHNTVKFKDMRSVDKAMLLLAKHEGEEIMGIDNTDHPTHHKMQEQGETASFNWLENYIYYVVPKVKVKPEPEYKTIFVDEKDSLWSGSVIGQKGTHYVEMKAFKRALSLRNHNAKNISEMDKRIIEGLMGLVK